MRNKIQLLLTISILLLFTQISFGQKNLTRLFEVKSADSSVAKVNYTDSKSRLSLIIQRAGQLDHTYTKDYSTGVTTVSVGKKLAFSYDSKSGQATDSKSTKEINNSNWLSSQNSEFSLSIQNQLLPDMEIFNSIRLITKTRITLGFELSFVIVTANESAYLNEKPSYSVSANDQPILRFFSECTQGCDTRLANCLKDVLPDQRIECYRIAESCNARCDKPGGEGPPEN